MVKRINLDAMIPREDFAISDQEIAIDLFNKFPVSYLADADPIRRLLRKPDFQRETNHWSPEQMVSFLESFLDNELIPSLILWKSPKFIFVIDGGHRLSALRAWREDDYGDRHISTLFYNGEISREQKQTALRTRKLVEQRIGRFSTLENIVQNQSPADEKQSRRARNLFTRALDLQWVQGTPSVAETSFFKINSQGTPLDPVEEILLRNRRKPISIGARAIIRAGYGHKYWSSFDTEIQESIQVCAKQIFSLLFDPEASEPIRTLDLPLGGSTSPVDALALLIDLLTLTADPEKVIDNYEDDADGRATIEILRRNLTVLGRITGNGAASLGLHPAVYFYNERGKHSRFLFMGMISLIAQKVRDNNQTFFRKFTLARAGLEHFMIENKSLIGVLLQNTSKGARVSRISQMIDYIVDVISKSDEINVEKVIEKLGVKGRFFDLTSSDTSSRFSDDIKSSIFLKNSIEKALRCPLCDGLLHPSKSVSYDHIVRRREGGTGALQNGQLVHPYCNTGMKN